MLGCPWSCEFAFGVACGWKWLGEFKLDEFRHLQLSGSRGGDFTALLDGDL